MNLNRKHFRIMIYYDYKAGLSELDCFHRLKSAFPDESPGKSTVYSWYAEFRRGRVQFQDETRAGRPATAISPENIEEVREMIEANPDVSYNEIRSSLGIGMTAIKRILYEHLGIKRKTEKTTITS